MFQSARLNVTQSINNTDKLAAKINAWAISPEGQKSLQETAKAIADMQDQIALAMMIPYEMLHTPTTNFTYYEMRQRGWDQYKAARYETPIVRVNG